MCLVQQRTKVDSQQLVMATLKLISHSLPSQKPLPFKFVSWNAAAVEGSVIFSLLPD